MNKKIISIVIAAVLLIANGYLVYRINSNTMIAASYDAGISQRSGVGKMESFWTKYVGASKSESTTYEDRANAESDSNFSLGMLILLDIVGLGALYVLNRKPKPVPVQDDEDDWRFNRRGGRLRRR